MAETKWEAALNKKIASGFVVDYKDFFKNDEENKPLFNEDPEDLDLIKELFMNTEKTPS